MAAITSGAGDAFELLQFAFEQFRAAYGEGDFFHSGVFLNICCVKKYKKASRAVNGGLRCRVGGIVPKTAGLAIFAAEAV